jgi:hypothetical protein
MNTAPRIASAAFAAFAAVLWSAGASAGTIGYDPLHAFCWGSSTCSDNNTVTPTTSNPPQFGFSISPGPQTGNQFLVDILVPDNNGSSAPVSSYSIQGSQGGASNDQTISSTASPVIAASAWTSGDLTTYLGLALNNGAPPNPLGAWLPSTQYLDSAATGYWVYQADLGTNQLWNNSQESSGPLLTIGSALSPGTLIVGFLGQSETCGQGKNTFSCELYISTAQSGALYVGSKIPPSVPEPGTLALFAAGLAGLGFGLRRRTARL